MDQAIVNAHQAGIGVGDNLLTQSALSFAADILITCAAGFFGELPG